MVVTNVIPGDCEDDEMMRRFLFVLACACLLAYPATAGALTATSFGAHTDYSVAARPINGALADLNADGRPDAIVPCAASDAVAVLLGTGAGGFGPVTTYRVGDGPTQAAAGDVNADGKVDVLCANEYSDNVSILLGDGAGHLGAATSLATGDGPTFVGLTRVNADSLPDLAVVNFVGDSLGVHLGTGVGTFGAPSISAIGDGPHGKLADVNRDGRTDALLSHFYSSTFMIRLNNGAGGFGVGTSYAVGLRPIALTSGDFDRDGSADVASVNYGGNTVTILLGNGSGGFMRGSDYAVGLHPSSADVADLNLDGNPDLVVSNYDSFSVSVLLGDGNGGFVRDADRAVSGRPYGVAAGDLNGDGKPDLMVSGATSNTVSVLLNTTAGSPPPPTPSGSLQINSGGPYATSTSVILHVSASGLPAQMMLANEPTFSGRSWQPYATSVPWRLSAGDGEKTVYAKFRSSTGAESGVTMASVLLDTIGPWTSRSSLTTKWTNKSLSFTLRASDAVSGVDRTIYQLTPPGTVLTYTGTTTISQEGTITLAYRSFDKAGNAESTKTATVRIDKTPPTTLSDARTVYVRTATIRLTAFDSMSGVAGTSYSLDGASAKNGASVTVTNVGTHRLTFWSKDEAGNTEAGKTVTFRIDP